MNEKRCSTATAAVYGSEEMLHPAPTTTIPEEMTMPEIAYRMVKDEAAIETKPQLNLATFVTTYMDDHATRLMNEAIAINYIIITTHIYLGVIHIVVQRFLIYLNL